MKRLISPLTALVCMAVLVTACRDNLARVIIDNKSECAVVAVRLENTAKIEVLTADVKTGQRHEFIVQPDVFYEYTVDFTAAPPDAQGFRCTALETGRVRVPMGASQTFTLDSQRQRPTATPSP